MPVYTDQEKALYLNQARLKVGAISRANRPYIDRAEEHARTYAEALADLGAISYEVREELYTLAKEHAEARVREFKAAEQAGREVTQAIAGIELQSALKRQ